MATEPTIMSILVVDDTEDGRDIFEAVLAASGYSDVMTAESAAVAFSILGLNSSKLTPFVTPDLVLLDAVMPEMDGFEACWRIREDRRYADLPIVITTALEDLESVNKAFRCGATNYLSKPLKQVDLVACVQSAIKLKEEFDKRSLVEQALRQHAPFHFENLGDARPAFR
jgi:phosphoserine phosphatase RsbU/P